MRVPFRRLARSRLHHQNRHHLLSKYKPTSSTPTLPSYYPEHVRAVLFGFDVARILRLAIDPNLNHRRERQDRLARFLPELADSALGDLQRTVLFARVTTVSS